MFQIVPNITTADLKEAKQKLKKLQGISNWVHVDILDGKFADTRTMSLNQLKKRDFPKGINIVVHLMTDNPLKHVDTAKEIGAKILISQIEKMSSQKDFVEAVIKKNMKVGLALDDGTEVEQIDKKVLDKLDMILIMTIKAGWVGRSFKKERLKEVKKLRNLKLKERYRFKIAVDGGVNKKTVRDCVQAGAEFLFMHSAVWKNKNIKRAIDNLYRLAKT